MEINLVITILVINNDDINNGQEEVDPASTTIRATTVLTHRSTTECSIYIHVVLVDDNGLSSSHGG